MIKYLKENKNISRSLWENTFEDTSGFLDFYYDFKTKNNIILGKFIQDTLVSMVHLNPYEVSINKKIFKSYYIVAVSTLKAHRKNGYMRELLNSAINHMNKKKIPFTFLKPAKEEIYLPFGFNFIYNHKILKFKENLNFEKTPISESDYQVLTNFTKELLEENYSVFTNRTEEYMNILHEEVKSENGSISMLYKDKILIGYYIYYDKLNQTRAIFTKEDITKIVEVKPLIMGRIINLEEFFKNIKTKNNETIELILNIKDEIILENNKIFKLTLTSEKGNICPTSDLTKNEILNIKIGDLTSLFFGYKTIDELINEKKVEIKNTNTKNKFYKIKFLNNVFFDEEV